jgi:hypothetical protein
MGGTKSRLLQTLATKSVVYGDGFDAGGVLGILQFASDVSALRCGEASAVMGVSYVVVDKAGDGRPRREFASRESGVEYGLGPLGEAAQRIYECEREERRSCEQCATGVGSSWVESGWGTGVVTVLTTRYRGGRYPIGLELATWRRRVDGA